MCVLSGSSPRENEEETSLRFSARLRRSEGRDEKLAEGEEGPGAPSVCLLIPASVGEALFPDVCS